MEMQTQPTNPEEKISNAVKRCITDLKELRPKEREAVINLLKTLNSSDDSWDSKDHFIES
ncbi:MAG: hypothetical protein HQM10_03725 [Candidatus Riflebacteria bacterium]|nr:hypothetical protein [Candidatus Riflebacteria bacterium]